MSLTLSTAAQNNTDGLRPMQFDRADSTAPLYPVFFCTEIRLQCWASWEEDGYRFVVASQTPNFAQHVLVTTVLFCIKHRGKSLQRDYTLSSPPPTFGFTEFICTETDLISKTLARQFDIMIRDQVIMTDTTNSRPNIEIISIGVSKKTKRLFAFLTTYVL